VTNGLFTFRGDFKSYQYGVAGTATLPINTSFSVFGKLGFSRNSARYEALGGYNAGTKTSPMIGFGANYNITPQIAVRVEYEDFGKFSSDFSGGDNIRANNLSASVKYAF
jgi:OOP family OmpA-OmpF porin